jgi:hypothetical protein
VKQLDYGAVRKRVLMFYFAAGLNLLMGLYVISAGSAVAERSTIWLISFIFIAFAGINYYMARTLTKRWQAQVRQARQNSAIEGSAERVKE